MLFLIIREETLDGIAVLFVCTIALTLFCFLISFFCRGMKRNFLFDPFHSLGWTLSFGITLPVKKENRNTALPTIFPNEPKNYYHNRSICHAKLSKCAKFHKSLLQKHENTGLQSCQFLLTGDRLEVRIFSKFVMHSYEISRIHQILARKIKQRGLQYFLLE